MHSPWGWVSLSTFQYRGNGPPYGGGLEVGGQQSIGGGMVPDAFATFNKSEFKLHNTFLVNCLG